MENVFAVFILVFIGAIVLIIFTLSAGEQDRARGEFVDEYEALLTARSLYTFPEFQCMIGRSVRDVCIDLLKAEMFQDYLENHASISERQTYYSLVGPVTISVVCLNCTDGTRLTRIERTIIDNEPEVVRSRQAYQLPVLVHDARNDTTSAGYLEIEVFR